MLVSGEREKHKTTEDTHTSRGEGGGGGEGGQHGSRDTAYT